MLVPPGGGDLKSVSPLQILWESVTVAHLVIEGLLWFCIERAVLRLRLKVEAEERMKWVVLS